MCPASGGRVTRRVELHGHQPGAPPLSAGAKNEINDGAYVWQSRSLYHRLEFPKFLNRIRGTDQRRIVAGEQQDRQAAVVLCDSHHDVTPVLPLTIQVGHDSHRMIIPQRSSQVIFAGNSLDGDIKEVAYRL